MIKRLLISLFLLIVVINAYDYTNYCSDTDNTFLPPCNAECFLSYGVYFELQNGTETIYIFREHLHISVEYELTASVDYLGTDDEFDDYLDKLILCENQHTGKSCTDYAQQGGLSFCTLRLRTQLSQPTTSAGTMECTLNSFCFCDAYTFVKHNFAYVDDLYYNITSSYGIHFCKTNPPPLSKRNLGTVYPLTINQESNENITCWLQDIGDSSFVVIHRDSIPLVQSTIIVDFGYGASTTYPYTTLDLPIEIPKAIVERGGIISATDIEGGLAVASCLLEISGDDCYGHSDSITDWNCASNSTRLMAILIYIVLFVAIVIGLILVIMILIKVLKCFFSTRYSQIPIISKTMSASGALVSMFVPAANALEVNNDDMDVAYITLISFLVVVAIFSFIINLMTYLDRINCRKMKNEPKDSKPILKKDNNPASKRYKFGIPSSAVVLFFLCLISSSYTQNCQSVFFLSQQNTNCVMDSGIGTCTVNTAVSATIDSTSKSICFSSKDPLYPFEVQINYISAIDKLNLIPIYWTGHYETISERACICDTGLQGEEECTACNEQKDVSICDSDETDFVQYQTTINYCSFAQNTDDCALLDTKVLTSNHYYITNGTPDLLVYEVQNYNFYPSVQVVVKANGTQTTCNAFLDTSVQTVCGINLAMTDPIVSPVPREFAIFKDVSTDIYRYTTLYNQPGQVNKCALGIMQAHSNTSTEEDQGNILWGNICDPTTYSSLNTGGCDTIQDFSCCDPDLVSGELPITTPYGYLEHQVYNGNDILYINTQVSTPLYLEITFNGNFSFQTTTIPVCPKVTYISTPTGCYDCDGVASFTLGTYSTCSSGSAVISCPGITIMNPVVNLLTSYSEYIINFKTDSKNVNVDCKLQATSDAKFNIKGSLSDPVFTLSGPTNSTNTEFFKQNKELSKIRDDNSLIKKLEIAFGVTISAMLILVVLLIICFCVFMSVTSFLKKMV